MFQKTYIYSGPYLCMTNETYMYWADSKEGPTINRQIQLVVYTLLSLFFLKIMADY